MVRLRSSSIFLLLAVQWAAGSCSRWCQAPGQLCNFVCDCSDCSDEQNCGYSGKSFICDFEGASMCGWTDPSSSGRFRWERLQGGDTLTESGPSSDYTTGTPTGWFMGVSAVKAESPNTAVLISPELQQSSSTCRVHLRYFLWDSGLTGLGSAPLWATVRHSDSREAVVWRPEASSLRGWREATVYVGRISSPFRIRFHSQQLRGGAGDVAIDQLEFLDCALPLPLPGKECSAGMLKCRRGGCVEERQVCDGSDDCGDGTDEGNCEGYRLCDFEEDWCDWDNRTLSELQWIRTNQESLLTTDPLKGPGRDHSTNTATGSFLYVTVPDGGLTDDWAAFQSPFLQPTNRTHPCKMVMYTHQFGLRSGGLTVLVADSAIYPVWQRGGALGDLWVKAEVEIVTDSIFQIVIMAAIRNFTWGGVAIDSIQLSPGCQLSTGNITADEHPKPPKDPCSEPDKLCDFHVDCNETADEARCGDFSYAEGSKGWTDSSLGSQGWLLHENTTDTDVEHLYVAKAPGQQLTEAQTRTPLLGPTGPACSMTFEFALTGSSDHIGELSVRVVDSVLGVRPKLWEYGGKTGAGEDEWRRVEIPIGVRRHRFQLALEARAVELESTASIKVKNVRFHSCHADNYPSPPTGLSCNFENGLCMWYQENSDDFDWTVLSGVDHTVGIGRSLVVDMWDPSLRGSFARLVSFPQSSSSSGNCLTFFYKLYGPNTGTLNVKLLDGDGRETVLWSRTGSYGNTWHEAECPVDLSLGKAQLVFEAVRSGFDGRVAIDDVTFFHGECSIPRSCSFEGHPCGYKTSGWAHLSGQSGLPSRPQSDHTLQSPQGFYLMANTGAAILPSGAAAVVTSPVRRGAAKTECLSFWYHTGGANPGWLTVFMSTVGGTKVELFSTNLNTENVWRHGNSDISSANEDWQLEFQVIGGGAKEAHVAIDDIFLSPHPCEGAVCTLETGTCSWSNVPRTSRADELDWELTSGETEQHYPTPPSDHTLGTEKGHFLLLPSQTVARQRAHLLSPHLPPTQGTCLKFWVYTTQHSRRQLIVWRLSNGRLNQLMELDDFSGSWTNFNFDIISAEEYQVVFEGIAGQSGVFALDDIEYTVGVNCDNKAVDTAPSDDNAGGVAAAVIVILLLVALLVGLVVYYLRTRRKAGPASSPPSHLANDNFQNDAYDDLEEDRVVIQSFDNRSLEVFFVPNPAREREV